MKYYNIKICLMLKQNLQYLEMYEKLFDFISFSMLKDEKLKSLHEKNLYKNYVFCNLYPAEMDGMYKANNVYKFDLRGIDFNQMIKMKQVIDQTETDYFKIIQTIFQTNEQREISTLTTLTPAIITTEKGDYKIDDNLEFVKKRILANTQKKYKSIYDTAIDIDFIESIRKLNEKPIKIPFKNMNFLGNKFEIKVKSDPMSQNLAFLVLSIGLLEKNALGMGMCRAR